MILIIVNGLSSGNVSVLQGCFLIALVLLCYRTDILHNVDHCTFAVIKKFFLDIGDDIAKYTPSVNE